jgi:hypothetical protein
MHGFSTDHRKQNDECQADQKDTQFDVFSYHQSLSYEFYAFCGKKILLEQFLYLKQLNIFD